MYSLASGRRARKRVLYFRYKYLADAGPEAVAPRFQRYLTAWLDLVRPFIRKQFGISPSLFTLDCITTCPALVQPHQLATMQPLQYWQELRFQKASALTPETTEQACNFIDHSNYEDGWCKATRGYGIVDNCMHCLCDLLGEGMSAHSDGKKWYGVTTGLLWGAYTTQLGTQRERPSRRSIHHPNDDPCLVLYA
ncbi:uncharacterized protein MYCFIDRAFT_173886 [Pseudocercospora fijiensis CIRAD86]|uniref:Uncharacterized protein n=1 Tax=Pseudocercospora fijiensis (strain CIRAD86) TaxID=383855 RepID=M2Z5C2_PSEFD|nr:uncharacterized protein MYCFIDRAFT_173886 [Pseudocercospora fijiensis CIRAD86]EME85015.1 hypothetical protein MYCFIDRAFT_173886 [Pseudocercospora fijiensis CIRAD86]